MINRIAALLHDIAKPAKKETDENGIDHFHGHAESGEEMANKILRSLKFDNDTIIKVKKYIKYHDYNIEPTEKSVRRAIYKIGEPYFEGVLEMKQADLLAQSYYKREEKQATLDQIKEIYQTIQKKKQCVSLKTLSISGKELMELGIPQGKELGNILNQLLSEVLDEPDKNNISYLSERAKEIFSN